MGRRAAGRAAGWIGVLLMVSACGQGSADPGDAASPGASALTGRAFLSTAVTQDGADRPLVAGSRIRLDFSTEGQVGIQAGCNSMSGRYRLEGDRLTLTDGLTSTEMGCPQPLMEQDTWISGLLTGGVRLTVDGDRLTVTGGTTTIRLLDERTAVPDVDLWETTWLLDGVEQGDTVSSATVGTTPSIRFVRGTQGSGSGSVQVRTGCNTGSGPVDVTDGAATFGPVALTRRACTDPAATAIENAMVTVLQDGSPARFTIKGDRLRLSRGGITLHLAAGPTGTAQPDQAVSSAP